MSSHRPKNRDRLSWPPCMAVSLHFQHLLLIRLNVAWVHANALVSFKYGEHISALRLAASLVLKNPLTAPVSLSNFSSFQLIHSICDHRRAYDKLTRSAIGFRYNGTKTKIKQDSLITLGSDTQKSVTFEMCIVLIVDKSNFTAAIAETTVEATVSILQSFGFICSLIVRILLLSSHSCWVHLLATSDVKPTVQQDPDCRLLYLPLQQRYNCFFLRFMIQ